MMRRNLLLVIIADPNTTTKTSVQITKKEISVVNEEEPLILFTDDKSELS